MFCFRAPNAPYPVTHRSSLAYDGTGKIFLGDPFGSVAVLHVNGEGGELEGGHRFLVKASSAENRRRLIGLTANEVVSGNDCGVSIFDRHEGRQTETLRIAKPGQWVSTVAVSRFLCLRRLTTTDRSVDGQVSSQASHRLCCVRSREA
jgi:hypothetical protein